MAISRYNSLNDKKKEKLSNELKSEDEVVEAQQKEVEIKSREIAIKDLTQKIRAEQLTEMQNGFKRNKIIFFIALVSGFLISTLGFFLWYFKTQRLNDVILMTEYLNREKISTTCQSCLRDLRNNKNEYGTNKEGEYNKLFCSNCLENGSFIEPNLTILEMKERIKTQMIALKFNKSQIKNKLKDLGSAERWKITY